MGKKEYSHHLTKNTGQYQKKITAQRIALETNKKTKQNKTKNSAGKYNEQGEFDRV